MENRTAEKRVVKSESGSAAEIRSLILTAVLLAAGAVLKFFAGTPYINFISEIMGALVMAFLIRIPMQRNISSVVSTFLATLVSGGLYTVSLFAFTGAAAETLAAYVPIVLCTALINCVIVGVLYVPARAALKA